MGREVGAGAEAALWHLPGALERSGQQGLGQREGSSSSPRRPSTTAGCSLTSSGTSSACRRTWAGICPCSTPARWCCRSGVPGRPTTGSLRPRRWPTRPPPSSLRPSGRPGTRSIGSGRGGSTAWAAWAGSGGAVTATGSGRTSARRHVPAAPRPWSTWRFPSGQRSTASPATPTAMWRRNCWRLSLSALAPSASRRRTFFGSTPTGLPRRMVMSAAS